MADTINKPAQNKQKTLEQIALERQMIEDSAFSSNIDNPPYDDGRSSVDDITDEFKEGDDDV